MSKVSAFRTRYSKGDSLPVCQVKVASQYTNTVRRLADICTKLPIQMVARIIDLGAFYKAVRRDHRKVRGASGRRDAPMFVTELILLIKTLT